MFVQKYIEYLKDNPEKYWFKRKIFGWGWTPATWQGWLTFVLFMGLIVGNAYRIDIQSSSNNTVPVAFLVQTLILVSILLVICYATGEKPRWQWDFPKETDKK